MEDDPDGLEAFDGLARRRWEEGCGEFLTIEELYRQWGASAREA